MKCCVRRRGSFARSKAIGKTQAELARAIGVSQQALFAYELGERRTSVLVLAKIAKVFAVPVGADKGPSNDSSCGSLMCSKTQMEGKHDLLRTTDLRKLP